MSMRLLLSVLTIVCRSHSLTHSLDNLYVTSLKKKIVTRHNHFPKNLTYSDAAQHSRRHHQETLKVLH